MNEEQIDAVLDDCGSYWFGGQRELIRKRLALALQDRVAPVGQTQGQSMVEALVGTGIGFAIALLSNIFMFWLYDLPATFSTSFMITVFFTGISIIRGYLVRRFFNWRQHAKTHR